MALRQGRKTKIGAASTRLRRKAPLEVSTVYWTPVCDISQERQSPKVMSSPLIRSSTPHPKILSETQRFQFRLCHRYRAFPNGLRPFVVFGNDGHDPG